jgi:hypothetical protein
MQLYNIDIAALIEISNNGHQQIRASIVTELDNLGYHQNNWQHTFVNVGDEGVAYIWHEEAQGANAFRRYAYINNANAAIAGPVLKDNNGANIYFPKTQTPWNSLPSKSNGRRPAYCAFETNDGNAARRFTLLDIHTPFNTNTQIQAYSTHLYASSRETVRVDTFDPIYAAQQAQANALIAVQNSVNADINNALASPGFSNNLTTTAVNTVLNAICDNLSIGATLQDTLRGGTLAGVNTALNILRPQIPPTLGANNTQKLAVGVGRTGAMAATYMLASITLPNGYATVNAAVQQVENQVQALSVNSFNPPAKKSKAVISNSITTHAKSIAQLSVAPFIFPALPTNNLNSSISAGDFNIDYPDNPIYPPILAGGNAYTALLNLANPNPAAINAKTTRIGPTAFEGQRIYKLKNPSPIQHNNPNIAATYVPLDVTTLAGQDILGNNVWIQTLQNLAQTQNIAWAGIINNPNYTNLLENAFDTTVINDTSYYRANAYDNIFVRNATITASGLIDVFSELGTWPGDNSGNNYWQQARGQLNATAQNHLNNLMQPIIFTYSGIQYTITPALQDAEEAAVFYNQYISDHLPVYVEIDV